MESGYGISQVLCCAGSGDDDEGKKLHGDEIYCYGDDNEMGLWVIFLLVGEFFCLSPVVGSW